MSSFPKSFPKKRSLSFLKTVETWTDSEVNISATLHNCFTSEVQSTYLLKDYWSNTWVKFPACIHWKNIVSGWLDYITPLIFYLKSISLSHQTEKFRAPQAEANRLRNSVLLFG